jgi:alpha-1,3-glucan synthase
MGDLHGFEGHLNTTAPFLLSEYKVILRNQQRQYHDFHPQTGDVRLDKCPYPVFWDETGAIIGEGITSTFGSCYDSEFNQAGDIEAFGVFPDWQRQVSLCLNILWDDANRIRSWLNLHPCKIALENGFLQYARKLSTSLAFRSVCWISTDIDSIRQLKLLLMP